MKAGYENKLLTASSSGLTNSSYAISGDTLKGCYLSNGDTLSITFDEVNLDFVSLFNYTGYYVQVILYRESNQSDFNEIGYMYDDFIYDMDLAYTRETSYLYPEEYNFSLDDATGLDTYNYILDLVADNNYYQIDIINPGYDTAFLGLVYAGDWIDFDCVEAMQPFDNSNDSVTIARANNVDVSESYLYQSLSVTLNKRNDLEYIRSRMRKILSNGYATSRPFLIQDGVYEDPELMLGILTSGRVGYDIIRASTEFLAQTTFEIREVV